MANRWLAFLTLVLAQFGFVSSFNLDGKDSFVYKGTPGEYFGYAVALHTQSNGKKWVVVGAPLGNKTSPSTEHNRYGSVYKCSQSDSTQCTVIRIDDRSPTTMTWKSQRVDMEEMTGQWLGATVISSPANNNGALMVCAPRYTYWGKVTETPEARERLLLGKCFVVRNDLFGVTKTIHPCYHGENGFSSAYSPGRDGTCEVGLSGAMLTSKVGNIQTFLMGMTGRYFSDGSIAVLFSDSTNPIVTPSWDQMRDPSHTNRAGHAMGYAVAIGRFRSSNREEFIASSIRATDLQGKVMAFHLDRKNTLAVSFTLPIPKDAKFQNGSNFGQSLCAVDLNNDGFSDLLVGAPYHSHETFGDEGRVYVYMNNGITPGTPLRHVPALTLDGKKTKRSLFGFAMAVAGDLNRDGYPEVAISAPYGGKDQGGVVYIFFGTKDGIETSPRQIIEASNISADIKTFGYSLAGNLDVDNNGYPDLAVGAYSSDKAFLLSINVTVCLKYKNHLPNPSFGSANVTYSIELDRDRLQVPFRRMFFLQGNKVSFSISRQVSLAKENTWYCQFNHTIYLREKDKILSVFDALTFDLVYDLSHSPSCKLCPILNDYHDINQRSFRVTAEFVKQCGPDKVCEPDLSVKGQVVRLGVNGQDHDELHVGDDNEITVRVVVKNKAADSAYPGKVIVTFPAIIDYASSNQDVLCSTVKENRAATKAEERKLECIVGNPFRKNAIKRFDIRFDTDRVTGNISELIIHLEAKSSSKDQDPFDNNDTIKVGVKFEADLSIIGITRPDQVVYSDKASEVKTVIDVGPSVKNIITVKNNGPSPVEYTEVTILVPFKNKTVEEPNYVLYLMDLQVLGNAGSCNIKTNPLNLQVKNNSNPTVQDSISSGKQKRELEDTNEELPCDSDSSLTCLRVPCYLGRMKREDHVQIQMTSRLWQNTLIKAKAGSVTITTTAKVIPSSFVPESETDNNVHKIQLTANPVTTPTKRKGTAVWIYVVSVLGGLALLALVGVALHKCGFFKRNRFKHDHTEEEVTPMRTLEPAHV